MFRMIAFVYQNLISVNIIFTGVAFRGLPNVKLYPSISAVYGRTEVCMVYLGQPLDG